MRGSGVPERSGTATSPHSLGDEYLTLGQLAAYSKISERQLRNYLGLPRAKPSPATARAGKCS